MKEKRSENIERLEACQKAMWDTLPYVLHKAKASVDRETVFGEGFTAGMFHILRNIHLGENTISALASCAQVSLPAVSRQVDSLVSQGLVTRARDPHNRRRIMLEISDLGKEKFELMMKSHQQFVFQHLSRMTGEELETTIAGLNLLRSVFKNDISSKNC